MQHRCLPLLLVMSFFGRPGFSQSSNMEVVTLPPPTTQAAPATAAATTPATTPATAATSTASVASPANAATAASVVPSLLYPTGNPVLNNIDSLAVNYITPWNAVDLTVSCGASADDTDALSFKASNLPQNGPYDLSPIQQSFNPSTYPIYCQITLEDAGNSGDSVDSGQFIMTSTGGSPTRYAQTATAALAQTASGANTGTASTPYSSNESSDDNNSNSSAQTGTPAGDSADNTAIPASASSTSSADSSDSSDSSSSDGLSSGAKAGIAIAIILFLALLALFIFLLLRYRRKLQKTQSELQESQQSAAAAAAAHHNEKAYLDSILKAAGKPDTSHGGRIVVADLGSRASGDWKQFFATKANSAKQAISSVGSRGNSRPGSRRTSRLANISRPGTAADEPVPNVPNLPYNPSISGSVGGDGSQVGLVNSEMDSEGPKKAVKRKPLPVS